METSYLKTLELDKIIARAAEGCVCKEARAMLLAIEPQCDPDEVRYALEQTDAINTLLIKNGSPRFGGVEGVSQLAARAVKGGVLSMGELLMVAGALRNFQHLTSWYGSGAATHASGMEMNAIASSIIGGTLLTGGVGNIIGTFFGVLSLSTIQNIVSSAGLDQAWWTGITIAAMLCLFLVIQSVVLARKKRG